jgi:protease-4
MLRFLTRFFAVIGLAVVLFIVLGAYAALHWSERPEPEPDAVILSLDFDQPIVERVSGSPLGAALNEDETSLIDVLRAIDKAKVDSHVKGIFGRFGSTMPTLTNAEEIRTALQSFRESGKFTYAFAPSYGEFGEGNVAYFLASSFENIWLQPVGVVSLTGLEIMSPFGKTALDKLGVKADFMQREEYKSFMDMATRDDFAPPVRDNMQLLLNDLARQESEGIAKSRGMDVEHVRDLMARGPYTDDEALHEKLVTHLGYYDELDSEFDRIAGKDAKTVDVDTYLGYGGGGIGKAAPKTKLAVIYGVGMIMDHDDGGPSMVSDKVMGADTLADAFDSAADDDDVKGILFRVDSPGGSPSASETIRRALVHAQKKGKPVVVSMGEAAASGGYWISLNADRIVADPATLTGSIGVLAGKFEGGELLKKLGVSFDAVKTTDTAGMWSMSEEFSPAQRQRMNDLLDNSYKAFTDRVAAGRHIPPAKIPEIAKGRVFTGAQAMQNGLVDELGGYGTALAALRKKAGIAPTEQVSLDVYPLPESPFKKVLKMLKGMGAEDSLIRTFAAHLPFLQSWLSMVPVTPIAAQSAINPKAIH